MPDNRVTIESLASGGDGVGRLPDGRTVFVPLSCPGDDAVVRVTDEHPRWARAEIVSLTSPSRDRVEPRCPYFGTCGGCQWQHVDYARQVSAKHRILTDALTRIGGLTDPIVDEVAPSPAAYGYRNKIELSTATVSGRLVLGYTKAGTADVLPIDRCPLLPPRAAGIPGRLAGALRFLASRGLPEVLRATIRVSTSGEVAVDLWTAGSAFPRSLGARVITEATGARTLTRTILRGNRERHDISRVEVLAGPGVWHERLGSSAYVVSAPSFFQVNSAAATTLRRLVHDAIEPHSTMRVGELYAGVGTFTLPLCEEAGDVVAAESSRFALTDLRRNLETAGFDADVVPGDAAYALPGLGHLDAAVVDPPRAGLSRRALDALLTANIPRIVYVSCDPATLARDVKTLMDAGYGAGRFTPVDLFPHTHHVETVARLEL